ncbi:MAG: PAS domain S-box protein, partial [Pseudomonadota bacterium]
MSSDRRQFELFFETAVDMLCVTDGKGIIQRVNPSWSRVLGWTQEELCGRRYLEFVHPDDREASIEAEKALMQEKRLSRFNNRYRTKGGDYRELEWSVVVGAEDGLIFATARDMTDNARVTVLADAVEKVSGVGSWRLLPDADGPVWSEMVFHIHEVPVGQMPELQEAINFYPPGAREVITEKMQILQETGKPYDVELPFITKKGRRRIVRATGAREDDCCCGGELYGTFQDITEMKKEEQRFAEIIRGTNAGTWQWNVQSGECFFNDRWADLVGYDLEELAPHSVDTWLELTHPDDSAESARRLDAHFAGETEFYQNEMRMKHKDGTWVWVLATGRVGTWTEDGKPEWVSGTHIDISQQKQHEADIIAAREAAEAANEAKSRFLATVSHEVRTPMNGVLGMAEILSRELKDPAQLTKVKLIKESGELLINVLNDILDFSKIEAGKVELDSAAFVPGEILRRVSRTYEGAAREKNISLSLVTRGDGERKRRGDETRIGQVLNNLVSNAVKFTTEGEVVLTSIFDEHEVTFEVRDTGIGMSPEAVETVFEPFTQADTS